MASSTHQVPALPVVVPLAAAAFVILVWRMHRLRAVTFPRVVVAGVMCVYGAGVVANTLLPIYIGGHDYHQSWRVFLNLTPLVNTEPFDMLRNVVVFVPLGFLLPLIAPAISARRVLLYGFLISLTMEALQFLNAIAEHGGHIADVNDLLANTLGAPIGYGIFRVVLLLPAAGLLAGIVSWPAPDNETSMSRPTRDSDDTGSAPSSAMR